MTIDRYNGKDGSWSYPINSKHLINIFDALMPVSNLPPPTIHIYIYIYLYLYIYPTTYPIDSYKAIELATNSLEAA